MESTKYRIFFWLVTAIVVIAAVLGIVYLGQPEEDNTSTLSPDKISDSDWTWGVKDAKVTIIEYSDFECPACAYFAEITDQLKSEFANHVQFAYRHFPLNIHVNAFPAAKATEAAGNQEKFFEMSAKLFENQSDWAEEVDPLNKFLQYAGELSLDLEKFQNDYASTQVAKAVQEDAKSAATLQLSWTPTFFVNGEKLTKNPRNYAEFRALVRAALEE